MLRKSFLTAMAVSAFVVPVLSLTAKSALAEDLNFSLTNGTESELREVYTSPSNVDDWGEDLLGSSTLAPGEGVQVLIPDGSDQCVFDVQVVFDDGTTLENQGIDFCALNGTNYEFVQ